MVAQEPGAQREGRSRGQIDAESLEAAQGDPGRKGKGNRDGSLLSTAVMKQVTKTNSGRMVYSVLYLTVHHEGKSAEAKGRNLEAGTEAEAMEECCRLAFSLGLAQSALLCNSGPYAQGWHHTHTNH